MKASIELASEYLREHDIYFDPQKGEEIHVKDLGVLYHRFRASYEVRGNEIPVTILCEVFVKDGSQPASYPEVKHIINMRKNAMMRPYPYIVSTNGFDAKSFSYAKRYGNVTLVCGEHIR